MVSNGTKVIVGVCDESAQKMLDAGWLVHGRGQHLNALELTPLGRKTLSEMIDKATSEQTLGPCDPA